MNVKEYFAFFLYWTPTEFAKTTMDKFFDDDEISRVKHHNPNSFNNTTRAMGTEIYKKYGNSLEADEALISISLEKIKSHPFRHLLVCAPLFWKGIFVELNTYPGMRSYHVVILCIFLFSGFIGFIILSLIKRKWENAAFVFLPIYLLSMHVLLTWCNGRHNRVLIPILWISCIVLLQAIFTKLLHRSKEISDISKE